jgi:predicted enzyme related to lactoylglutathione lyase
LVTIKGEFMSEKPKIGEFCWNELATPNVKAAKDFYGKVFGWQFSDHEMGDATYTMIQNKNQPFAGIWSIPKGKEKEIPPHWMAYILVENLDASVEKARKNGANIVKPAANAGEMGRFAVITDPTGAHIALWETLKNA